MPDHDADPQGPSPDASTAVGGVVAMDPALATTLERFDLALDKLAQAPAFARPSRIRPVLDLGKKLLLAEGGAAALQTRASRFDEAGVFEGTDWAEPDRLDASLSRLALTSAEADTVVIEALSGLRLVAVALGEHTHERIDAAGAREHLVQVLAVNLSLLFGPPSEVDRVRQGRLAQAGRHLARHVAERIGYEQVLGQLVGEIWRLLDQRPIQVSHIKRWITEIAVHREDPDVDLGSGTGADRLITALYGTTIGTREDPGIDAYRERLGKMDRTGLSTEATGFARAMHDTGLVSPYHAVLVDVLREHDDHLLSEALGLTVTGRDSLLRHRDLIHALIGEGITPATAQGVLGLALLLERGVLHQRAVPPALWRQLRLRLSEPARQRLRDTFGPEPAPRTWLLSGVMSMLGQPLGVGQGDNPTCQSARALSMWAENDPDYLLQLVAHAGRDDEIVAHFEGQSISSRDVADGMAGAAPVDLDPVSALIVPHLDRIYVEMGRRCAGREGDPHRWVNPEFHGWWAWRGFRINVDVATGQLVDLEGYLRDLYAAYHPAYNGDQPLTHPQPAGLAVTAASGTFVGWHAITLLRVARDPEGVVRFYFFNPNDDSGQDWGDDVVVSTSGLGERPGESSLPFEELASRLYIFHVDPLEQGDAAAVPDAEVAAIIARVHRTWGAQRRPTAGLQAEPDTGEPTAG